MQHVPGDLDVQDAEPEGVIQGDAGGWESPGMEEFAEAPQVGHGQQGGQALADRDERNAAHEVQGEANEEGPTPLVAEDGHDLGQDVLLEDVGGVGDRSQPRGGLRNLRTTEKHHDLAEVISHLGEDDAQGGGHVPDRLGDQLRQVHGLEGDEAHKELLQDRQDPDQGGADEGR